MKRISCTEIEKLINNSYSLNDSCIPKHSECLFVGKYGDTTSGIVRFFTIRHNDNTHNAVKVITATLQGQKQLTNVASIVYEMLVHIILSKHKLIQKYVVRAERLGCYKNQLFVIYEYVDDFVTFDTIVDLCVNDTFKESHHIFARLLYEILYAVNALNNECLIVHNNLLFSNIICRKNNSVQIINFEKSYYHGTHYGHKLMNSSIADDENEFTSNDIYYIYVQLYIMMLRFKNDSVYKSIVTSILNIMVPLDEPNKLKLDSYIRKNIYSKSVYDNVEQYNFSNISKALTEIKKLIF